MLQSENFRREKQLVKDAAEFLLLSQIPSFVSIAFVQFSFASSFVT
jgi:hypothetical protein